MRNAFLLSLCCLFMQQNLYSQNDTTIALKAVQVIFNRAASNEPITFSTLKPKEIQLINFGQDIPVLLDRTISVNTASDAGNGVGYTYLRLRGSDQTRINVTLNGVPYNDAESHQVFWVNLPDFISSATDVQIQRGLGTSNNGAGAFGGTVNISTAAINKQPFFQTSNSYGSFNTLKNTVGGSTGLIKNKFVFDARYSQIFSDGYIDRASSKLYSYYVSGAFVNKGTAVHLIHFLGKEKTYQAWYGIPTDSLRTNRTLNTAGTDFGQKTMPYANESDNYTQSHYQLLISQTINAFTNFSGNVFYVKGGGYYEQYKVAQSLNSYGFQNVYTEDDTITTTDMIRQRWLKNKFFGANLAFTITKPKLNWKVAAGFSNYGGDHFGKVIWAPFGSTIPLNNKYYKGNGNKVDANIYSTLNYKLAKVLSLYIDMQYRFIDYTIQGEDDNGLPVAERNRYHFFNPKVGMQANFKEHHHLNFYAGIGHHEPLRDDFVNKRSGKKPLPEAMLDIELGYQYTNKKVTTGINLYGMFYKNQLVVTGALNDVGAAIRTNVDKSFRLGAELACTWQIHKKLTLISNATFSLNKILQFNEIINTYDQYYVAIDSLKITNKLVNKNIAFSPSILGYVELQYQPLKNLVISLNNKYTGKQYLDNTQNNARSLKPYNINNLIVSYTLHTKPIDEIICSIQLNNITNRKYISNGYTYSERYAGPGYLTDVNTYNYIYPQAGFNLMAGITIKIK